MTARRLGSIVGVAVAALLVLTCTNEQVVSVDVHELSVEPPAVSVLLGDSVQLSARVTAADGRRLDDAPVTWRSENPARVSVGPRGTVRALGVGAVAVWASFGGSEASGHVTVFSGSSLFAEPARLLFHGAADAESPRGEEVLIQDRTGAQLDGLTATVAYPAATLRPWVTTRAREDARGAILTVAPDASGLPAGSYGATVLISVPSTDGLALPIPVVLTVAALRVVETEGGTRVSSREPSDELRVFLELAPRENVVVRVASTNPGIVVVRPETLVFRADNWLTPQTIDIQAASGAFPGAATSLNISVDDARSDPSFHPVGDVVVPVSGDPEEERGQDGDEGHNGSDDDDDDGDDDDRPGGGRGRGRGGGGGGST